MPAVSARAAPLIMFTRLSERCEFIEDSLADEIIGWGGGEPGGPDRRIPRLADRLGLRVARVGLETPAYYLHPHHYIRLKDYLGPALVAEPVNLSPPSEQVKSPREIALIRQSARIADLAMARLRRRVGRRPHRTGNRRRRLSNAAGPRQFLPASAINLVTGERCGFAHGAPTLRRLQRGRSRQRRIRPPPTSATPRRSGGSSTSARPARACAISTTWRAPRSRPALAKSATAFRRSFRTRPPKRVIAEAGMDRYRLHTTGYGIGPGVPPSWGEPLNMFGGSTDVLRAGMVVSIEPPVFIAEERLGARIIDNVLVTETGAELLSEYPRDMIIVD